MAILTAPTPQQVFDRVNQKVVSYGFFTEDTAPVFALIDQLKLITTAAAMAESAADGASAPFDFPLPVDVIAARNPTFSAAQVQERFEKQSDLFTRFMIDRAAADLVLELKPDRVDQQTIQFRNAALLRGAKDSLDAGVSFVQKLLAGSAANTPAPTVDAQPLTNVQLFRAD